MSATAYPEQLDRLEPDASVGTPIYDSVAAEAGFSLDDLGPTPTADDLVAMSYIAYDRRHARTRRRDEHGRFLAAVRDVADLEADNDDNEADEDQAGDDLKHDAEHDADNGESAP